MISVRRHCSLLPDLLQVAPFLPLNRIYQLACLFERRTESGSEMSDEGCTVTSTFNLYLTSPQTFCSTLPTVVCVHAWGLFRLSVNSAAWNGSGTHLNFDISIAAILTAELGVNGGIEINVFLPSIVGRGNANARCENSTNGYNTVSGIFRALDQIMSFKNIKE